MLHVYTFNLCTSILFSNYCLIQSFSTLSLSLSPSLSLRSPNTFYFIFSIITWKYGIANLGNLHEITKKSYTRKWHDEFDSSVNDFCSYPISYILNVSCTHVCFPIVSISKLRWTKTQTTTCEIRFHACFEIS